MRLNFSTLASLVLASAALVAALPCNEAARFGILAVSPTTLAPGDTFTANVDLTCAAELGFLPTFMDYYIEVLANNNGHEAPILLARHTFNGSAGAPLADSLTTELPAWFYFADAQYSVVFQNSFAKPGPNNNSVITVGGISASINITGI
ncbi:hypothetical protein DFH09DRAFT_1146138 [Mycena vulgaris]|nr:hypothetical protein DFH09DRAFT_1146138 [Mycena vulgaris]